MKMTRYVFATLSAAIFLTGIAAKLSYAQLPTNATLYASGLEGPRGLTFGPDGSLYVAEAGLGGTTVTTGTCAQAPAPYGPYTGGLTARISKIDQNGTRTTVTSGLPSAQSALPTGDTQGVADVAFLNGELYAVLAGGGCSHGNPTVPNAIVKVNLRTGKWSAVADLSLTLAEHPAQYTDALDYEPDGVFYSLIGDQGRLYTVEPNHGQVFSVTPAGAVKQVIDISASQGHIVPTSIVALDDLLYIGNLDLFPINPLWSKVMTLSKDTSVSNPLPGFGGAHDNSGRWKIVDSKAGFTTVTGMKIGPDGLLYVLELSAAAGYPTPGAGKVVRMTQSGAIEDVVTGLVVPTGIAFGPDGALYVSNLGAVPGNAGDLAGYGAIRSVGRRSRLTAAGHLHRHCLINCGWGAYVYVTATEESSRLRRIRDRARIAAVPVRPAARSRSRICG